MNKKIFLLLLSSQILFSQDLKTTVEEILSTNPIILERLKNYNATKEDITIAQAGYYPKIDLSLGAGHEQSDKDSPNLGEQSFDFSVYQNSLSYTQNLFKGFETNNRVREQEHRTTSAAYNYIEKVNDTAFTMVDTYLQVMKNKELIGTAQANVDINTEIFIKVKKLYDAGLTTLSEVNKIESSLSLAKSNLVVQENTLLDVKYNLHRVLGRDLDASKMSRPTLNIALPSNMDEATQFAIRNNPSLIVSEYNIKLAQASYQVSLSPYYPSFDIEISQSMNRNLSGVEGDDDRFRAMAFISYNFFNGFSDSATKQKNISNIYREIELKNQLRRETIEGLRLSWAAYTKLKEQLVHLKDYKRFSKKTLTLYSKEYDLGRRSLLDLLSAQNDFIGSKAQIINTEYNLLFAQYRILDAMGIMLPSIIDDTSTMFSNVGLDGKTPQNIDALPIKLDQDNDLIVDDEDLCANSLDGDLISLTGCKTKNEINIDSNKSMEKVKLKSNIYLFENKSSELTNNSKEKLQNFTNGFIGTEITNLHFNLLGHANYNDMDKKELLKLSEERILSIKKVLFKAGVNTSNIKTIAKSDTAPLYLEDGDSNKFNNRVDIIIYLKLTK